MIIYKITFPNNKVYIGQTMQKFTTRQSQHYHLAFIKQATTPLYSAIRKFDINTIKWEIIDRAKSRDDLNQKETYWIKFYRSFDKKFGYNCNFGGDNREVLANTKEKIRKKLLGSKLSLETRKKISLSLTGKPKSIEHIKNATEASRLTRKTEEYKNKLSKIHKGKKIPYEVKRQIAKSKGFWPFEVYQNGIFVGYYETLKECAKILNLSDSKICSCLKGQRKNHKGYTFRFKNG